MPRVSKNKYNAMMQESDVGISTCQTMVVLTTKMDAWQVDNVLKALDMTTKSLEVQRIFSQNLPHCEIISGLNIMT